MSGDKRADWFEENIPGPAKCAAPAPPTKEPTPIRRGVSVTVEATDDGRFWVTRIRDGDQARGAMCMTRDELVELRARIGAALALEEER